MQVAATEFICFVTSDIIEEVHDQQRVAIKDQDLLESMNKLGFSHFVPTLETMAKKIG
jgi:hypothetical protein